MTHYLTNLPLNPFTLNSNRSSMLLLLPRSDQRTWQPQRLTQTEQQVLQFTAHPSHTRFKLTQLSP